MCETDRLVVDTSGVFLGMPIRDCGQGYGLEVENNDFTVNRTVLLQCPHKDEEVGLRVSNSFAGKLRATHVFCSGRERSVCGSSVKW